MCGNCPKSGCVAAAVTSALIGASRPGQLDENVAAIQNLTFTTDELQRIDKAVG